VLYSSFISIHQACVIYIHIPFLVLVELLLKNNSVVDMFFRMTNPVNKAVFVRVVEAIHHDYGGKEQCPWTSAQLKVSCDVYYKSLSNANQRKRKNTEVGHRTTCRRTGRMGAVSIEI